MWKPARLSHYRILSDNTVSGKPGAVQCLEEYGRSIHGTTGLAPLDAFLAIEKPALRGLPKEPFAVASWGTAKVGRDQFAVVLTVRYGLPAVLIGKSLSVRITATTVEFFHEHRIVRSYVKNGQREQFLPADFPDAAQPFVPGAYARALRANAATIGPMAAKYIDSLLKNDTQVAWRRATACLAFIKENASHPGLSHALAIALAEGIHTPQRLEALLGDESSQRLLPFPVSESGTAMTRAARYYAEP